MITMSWFNRLFPIADRILNPQVSPSTKVQLNKWALDSGLPMVYSTENGVYALNPNPQYVINGWNLGTHFWLNYIPPEGGTIKTRWNNNTGQRIDHGQ